MEAMLMRKRVASPFLLICILFSLAGVYYLFIASEITHKSFKEYKKLSESGIIEAGWIPAWLPKTAYNIEESHDIDSNVTWLAFNYSPQEKFYLNSCELSQKTKMKFHSNQYINRFPAFVKKTNSRLFSNSFLTYYHCKDKKSDWYLSVFSKENLAFAWTNPAN